MVGDWSWADCLDSVDRRFVFEWTSSETCWGENVLLGAPDSGPLRATGHTEADQGRVKSCCVQAVSVKWSHNWPWLQLMKESANVLQTPPIWLVNEWELKALLSFESVQSWSLNQLNAAKWKNKNFTGTQFNSSCYKIIICVHIKHKWELKRK